VFFPQCYDLRNYLSSNVYITGSRWRCASCESFVSVESLEVCCLTAHLLLEFKDIASADRDRIEFCSDGSYKLLEPRKVRKKRSATDALTSTETKRPRPDDEVIELM
jgi:hypothetical protein